MQPAARSNPARLIAFVLPHLKAGGAERLTIDLAEELLGRGFRVDLVLLEQAGEFLAQRPAGARVIGLSAKRFRQAVVPLRRYLKQEQPDAVCAAMWPLTVVALASSLGLRGGTRMIVVEHTSPLLQYGGSFGGGLALRATTRASYRLAHGIAGTANGVADEIARLAGLDRKRVTTIHNPVKPPACSNLDPASLWGGRPGKRILSVGRLTRVKNFPLLIAAFAKLLRSHDATLAIVGDGKERAALEAAIRAHGLEGRVLLPGFTATPGDWYRGADLFVLSSDFEGFGNVLVEAMHCGLRIVSTDCPHGPPEVLGGGRWGRLAPVGDADALAGAMADALDAPADPEAQRRRAADFGIARAADAYQALMFGAEQA